MKILDGIIIQIHNLNPLIEVLRLIRLKLISRYGFVHEVSVTSDLVRAILDELQKYKVVSVHAVTLTIGRLTNLGGEQMQFAYEVVTRDTILEGSDLIIEDEEVELECMSCDYKGPARNLTFGEYTDEHFIPVLACPVCGGAVRVTKGKTCCVKNIDIEEAE